MSITSRRRKHRRIEKSSLQILEEVFHLLRTVDLKYYWIFFLGVVPFVVALLYFMADMSRSSLASESMLPASILMVVFYFWLRITQAEFCRGLWQTVQPGSELISSPRERFRQLSALLLIQAFQVPLLIVGVLIALPLGWIIAFLQNVTALSLTRSSAERPFRELFSKGLRFAHWEWGQNHGILLVLAFVVFFTWVNLVGTCLVLATFAKSFFGVESVFTTSPLAATLNSTFALGTVLLTYLVISPILKGIYTLRCFYAQSRSSGEDLLSRLASVRGQRREEMRTEKPEAAKPVRAALLGFLFLSTSFASAQSGEEGSSPDPAAQSREVALERSIGETMEQKKYQWQLSRRMEGLVPEDSERSWLSRQMKELADSLEEWVDDFGRWFEEITKRRFDPKRMPTSSGSADSRFLSNFGAAISIGLVIIVAALVTWIAVLAYRKYKSKDEEALEDAGVTETVDLHREDIVASELPEDEWMRLAREQIDRGEGRLAVRALFLASLARLGEEDLLRIARFKSNRDYRRELARKARKWEELNRSFAENIVLFERTWYGWHEVTEETVSRYLSNHEVIVNQSEKAGRRRFEAPAQPQTV
ncbi:MAG: hypothetical protein AAGF67_08655 [Verrucomicrobiota bacterium]